MNISVSHIIEESFQEFPPYISLVVFVSKCNLNCYKCPNKGSKSYNISIEEVINKLSNPLLDALVVIGGEPTMYPTEIKKLLNRTKNEGKHTKVFTNGCKPNVIKDWLEEGVLDAISIDLKSIDNFEEVSCVDISTSNYLKLFEECLNTVLQYPNVQVEVRTTQLMKDSKIPLSNIEKVKEYMMLNYSLINHIIQDDAFEFM